MHFTGYEGGTKSVNIGGFMYHKGYVTLLFFKRSLCVQKREDRPFDLLVDSHQIMSVYFGRSLGSGTVNTLSFKRLD